MTSITNHQNLPSMCHSPTVRRWEEKVNKTLLYYEISSSNRSIVVSGTIRPDSVVLYLFGKVCGEITIDSGAETL